MLGLAFSLLMYFGAEQLAAMIHEPLGFWPIRALAPAVFCVCLLACMRGYTQGQGNMTPTAVSQVLEALLKLAIGLPLAWYVLRIGMSLEMGAAAAILGVTAGTAVSMLLFGGIFGEAPESDTVPGCPLRQQPSDPGRSWPLASPSPSATPQ